MADRLAAVMAPGTCPERAAAPAHAPDRLCDVCCCVAVQTLDDAEGGGERVVVKSPGGAIRVEVSSSSGDVSVFYDGSPEPLVRKTVSDSSGCRYRDALDTPARCRCMCRVVNSPRAPRPAPSNRSCPASRVRSSLSTW